MEHTQPWDILKTAIGGNQPHPPASGGTSQPSIIFAQAAANRRQLALNAAGFPYVKDVCAAKGKQRRRSSLEFPALPESGLHPFIRVIIVGDHTLGRVISEFAS
jgi:hypothetical protein